VLPGFLGGMRNVALDEQRHIGFGVKLLRDLAREDPDVPLAVADLLREVLPYTASVFVPPNWDRRYSECFGFTIEQIFEEGARSFESKLRAAGLALETLPGPIPYPYDLEPAERARRGVAMLEAGLLGQRNGTPPRDPATMELMFDMLRRGVDPRRSPAEPLTLQWDFPGRRAVAPARRQRQHGGGAGFAERPDVVYKVRYDDFVDVFAGPARPAPRRAHRQAAPAGSVKALWASRAVRRLFGITSD
jgi:hypothetical protein